MHSVKASRHSLFMTSCMDSSLSLATLAHLLAHARSSRTPSRSHAHAEHRRFKAPLMLKQNAFSPSLPRMPLSPLRDAALTDPLMESCYSRMLPLHAQPPTPIQSDRQPTPLTRTRLYCHVRNTLSTCHTLTLVSLSTNSIVEESNLQRTKVNGRRPRTESCGHLVCNVACCCSRGSSHARQHLGPFVSRNSSAVSHQKEIQLTVVKFG